MNLQINSSLISKASYNKETEELIVTFTKGDTWKYLGVTQEEANNFKVPTSQGSFFLHNIKPIKKAVKI